MENDQRRLGMVRLHLSTPGVMALGKRRRLPLRSVDLGYLVHVQIGELFGDLAPSPFAVVGEQGRILEVLSYTDREGGELLHHAKAFADPGVHANCDWSAFAYKPLPMEWQRGARLGFRVRACPVIRMSSAGGHHRAGAEVDAFLAACWKVGDTSVSIDREAVYRKWLERQLWSHGRAKLLKMELVAFKRSPLLRRGASPGRRPALIERPDALIRGDFEVTDDVALQRLLARGVGRHRGFGFGMLLLRPAVARC